MIVMQDVLMKIIKFKSLKKITEDFFSEQSVAEITL